MINVIFLYYKNEDKKKNVPDRRKLQKDIRSAQKKNIRITLSFSSNSKKVKLSSPVLLIQITCNSAYRKRICSNITTLTLATLPSTPIN